MINLSQQTKFCLNFFLVNTRIAKKMDSQLSIHGISFSEYLILYQLSRAIEMKMRRIDLAETIGLSASGITRLVGPMEKIGLVEKEANARDARVSLVKLSPAGLRILEESTVSLNITAGQLTEIIEEDNIRSMQVILKMLGGHV